MEICISFKHLLALADSLGVMTFNGPCWYHISMWWDFRNIHLIKDSIKDSFNWRNISPLPNCPSFFFFHQHIFDS